MKRSLTLFLLAYLMISAQGQTSLPIPRNVKAAYDNGTRNMTGTPGEKYWQNSANYDIQVNFDPLTRIVSGTENINYKNNSPDTLRMLVFKVFPNIYSKGVSRVMGIDSADVTAPVKIGNLKINGDNARDQWAGTNMYVPVKPVNPGTVTNISLNFSFRLNKGSGLRGGQSDNGAFFIPYFFPRLAVYDDIDGWDTYRYLGQAEFYNDFCNFRLSVTVPDKYVVWATGTLTNPSEVFNPVYSKRLEAAEKSDEISAIIDEQDIAAGNITAANPYNTFRFEAENVTDVAFAVSNHYLWRSSSVLVDSASGRRTRVDAVFPPDQKDFYEVAGFARQTVKEMSYYFPRWPYPYQHETVFNCRTQKGGMEFPMMVNDGNFQDRVFTIDVTLHEIFHTMFPFYTGLNETKYGWMDEGMATLSNWILAPRFSPGQTSPIVSMYIQLYSQIAGTENDPPVSTLSIQMDDPAFTMNSYIKPAIAFYFLRDMVGEDLFLKGLQQFISDWKGKHPLPYDFFISMNKGTGLNLNWYWNGWFLNGGVPDLAISGIASDKKSKVVTVEMKGQKPVPVELKIKFTDGTTQTIYKTAAVWEKGKIIEIRIAGNKAIKELNLGTSMIPDVNTNDNNLVVK